MYLARVIVCDDSLLYVAYFSIYTYHYVYVYTVRSLFVILQLYIASGTKKISYKFHCLQWSLFAWWALNTNSNIGIIEKSSNHHSISTWLDSGDIQYHFNGGQRRNFGMRECVPQYTAFPTPTHNVCMKFQMCLYVHIYILCFPIPILSRYIWCT